jgi:DedD protein
MAAGVVDTAPAVPAVRASAVPVAPSSAPGKAAVAAPAVKASAVPAAASLAGKEEIVTDKAPAKPESRASQPAPKAATPDDGAKAKALLDGKAPEASAADGRFVVQVGAYADTDKAREARLKLERAGLKTYAQVVETKDGKRTRVRLGPFATRAQAEEAAVKAKALSLPAAILAL